MTLTWNAPSNGDPATTYIIEAGSAPGLANLANFQTGNTLTVFQASDVGGGTYYVRVRAVNSGGVSAPSNDAILTVGGGAPCVTPGAPTGLALTFNAGGVVSFAWNAATGSPTSYIIEAGALPGLANIANSDLGGSTSMTATGVGAGTYYVRMRAKNACGISAPSNEVVLVVGIPPPTPTPTPGPTTGRLAISTTASQGWSSITVTINGQVAGTLTRYFEPGNPTSCDAVAGARVVTVVPAGVVSYSARTESGGTWSGSAQVSPNGCSEIALTCPNRNCSGTPTPTPTPTPPPSTAFYVWGGANYTQYLGFFSCVFCTEYGSDSVNNPYGTYGSPYSSTSIRNQYSLYGGAYSTYSPCNAYTTSPPKVYNADRSVYYGRLTINKYLSDAITSSAIIGWLQGDVCK